MVKKYFRTERRGRDGVHSVINSGAWAPRSRLWLAAIGVIALAASAGQAPQARAAESAPQQSAPFKPASPAIFGVMAVDVDPEGAGLTAALLKRYRAAAARQPGNRETVVLQQIDQPGRFLVYEEWQDKAAFDANEKAAHTVEFCRRIEPVDLTPCDRRSYFVQSVGARGAAPGRRGIYMMTQIDVLPRNVDTVSAAVRQSADALRGAGGNLRYDVVGSVELPTNYLTVFSAWKSRRAFDEYEMSPAARAFRDAVGPYLGSPFNDRLYIPVK